MDRRRRAAFGFASTASAQTLKIGSKNFTEQFIVAELYAAALEAAGFKVERKINLGGTLVAHEALNSGAIDLYPEYTGTGLNAVMKAQGVTETDPEKVREMVKAFYEKEFKLTWLKPSGINNGYAIIVRPETAQEMNLKTLTDLAKVSPKLKLGAGPEFADRRDGIKGLKEVYGIEFGEFRQFAALRLRYDALIAEADRRRQRLRHRLADRGREVRGARRRQGAVPALFPRAGRASGESPATRRSSKPSSASAR